MKNYSFVIWLLLFISTCLWVLSKPSVSIVAERPLRSIAQISAIWGATGYFLTTILSSRLPFIEDELPLDQAYKLHRIVGTVSGSGLLLHVTGLIASQLPSPFAASLYLLPSANVAYTAGVLAFYLLLLLLFTTLYVKLPYDKWKFIHSLTSYSIIFAVFHLFLIPSDISTYIPLRLWMLGLAGAGFVAWLYRKIVSTVHSFSHLYVVSKTETASNVTLLTLTSQKKPLTSAPGQFAFFKFLTPNGPTSSEEHPFTILRQNGPDLTIAIKSLGDDTRHFHTLRPGTQVLVTGPHGSFGKKLLHTDKPAIWIAGGIGVTPFLSVLETLALQKSKPRTLNTSFFYTTAEQDNFFHPLLSLKCSAANIPYTYRNSSLEGRIRPAEIFANLALPAHAYNYFLCGPRQLIEAILAELRKLHVPEKQVFFEEFEFNSLDY